MANDLQKIHSQKMAELMKPIDRQIMMCDDREEVVMLACGMLQRVKEIMDQQLGEEGRKMMFREFGQGNFVQARLAKNGDGTLDS